MTLPSLLVLTDRTQCAGPMVDVVAALVDGGARAVLLREKDLPECERAALAQQLRPLLEDVAGRLLIAGPRGDDVHLSATDPFPRPRPRTVGRSCHSRDEVVAAAGEGCDYVTVSPVFPSASKPGYGPALGTEGLATLTALAPPVYALGGIRPEHVPDCRAAGAAGVAVMGTLMRAPELVTAYVGALRGET